MADKANVIITETNEPLDKMREFGWYLIQTPPSGYPPGYTTDSFFALFVSGRDIGWSPWLLMDLRTGATFRGGYSVGQFMPWVPIATATPPEWHNAPLETGWSWTTQGKYGKDGSGKGYLIGVVNKASVPTSGEAILRLPTGFRPPVLWPVSFSSAKGTDGSSWATYGYLWPDGYLRFHGGALPANYSLNQGIAFCVEFPAV